jgi:hypothetical protein
MFRSLRIVVMVTITPAAQRSGFYRILSEWPAVIKRSGIVITSFGDNVPFTDYMLCDNLVLLDRGVPDTSGARRVILAIDTIVGIKITDPIEMARFTVMGFQANMAR